MIIAENKGVIVEGNTSDIMQELKSTIETVRAALSNEYDSKVADNLINNCFARAMRAEKPIARY